MPAMRSLEAATAGIQLRFSGHSTAGVQKPQAERAISIISATAFGSSSQSVGLSCRYKANTSHAKRNLAAQVA